MTTDYLNNSNKTTLLFKKFQNKTQAGIDTGTGGTSFFNEQKKSLNNIYNKDIFIENIERDLPDEYKLSTLDACGNIPGSAWNTSISDQDYSESSFSIPNTNLIFYKEIYLNPVSATNNAWWLIPPGSEQITDNNLLKDMIPFNFNSISLDTFSPIVKYWNGSEWKFQSQNNVNGLNWLIDYASGILQFYQNNYILNSLNINCDSSVEKKRPRISFIKYVGGKGLENFLGGGSISGNITILQGNVSTLQTEMGAVEGNITTLQGNISTLQTEMGAVEGNITILQGNVSNNINQPVKTTSNVRFNKLTISDTVTINGNLFVRGNKTFVDSVEHVITDTLITLNSKGLSDPIGIEGNTSNGNIIQFVFDQTNNYWHTDGKSIKANIIGDISGDTGNLNNLNMFGNINLNNNNWINDVSGIKFADGTTIKTGGTLFPNAGSSDEVKNGRGDITTGTTITQIRNNNSTLDDVVAKMLELEAPLQVVPSTTGLSFFWATPNTEIKLGSDYSSHTARFNRGSWNNAYDDTGTTLDNTSKAQNPPDTVTFTYSSRFEISPQTISHGQTITQTSPNSVDFTKSSGLTGTYDTWTASNGNDYNITTSMTSVSSPTITVYSKAPFTNSYNNQTNTYHTVTLRYYVYKPLFVNSGEIISSYIGTSSAANSGQPVTFKIYTNTNDVIVPDHVYTHVISIPHNISAVYIYDSAFTNMWIAESTSAWSVSSTSNSYGTYYNVTLTRNRSVGDIKLSK